MVSRQKHLPLFKIYKNMKESLFRFHIHMPLPFFPDAYKDIDMLTSFVSHRKVSKSTWFGLMM